MNPSIATHPLLAEPLAAIAESVRQYTVQVRESGQTRQSQSGGGSGVIWSADGVIVTNAHVIRGDQAEVRLADDRTLSARVTARNELRDLVALKVEASDLPAATVADSDQVRVGEFVLAVGNPLGMSRAVTTGIVHTVGKPSDRYRHWIQADITLAPGNSGGPLANASAQVIGINTLIADERGFAIASNVVQRFLQQPQERPYLGVTMQPVRVPQPRSPRFGLLITAVEPESPADAARLQVGDVMIGVRGQPFQQADELMQILRYSNVGDGLRLWVLRGSQMVDVDVVLCSRNSAATIA